MPESVWKIGSQVRVKGLVKAAQHNGKIGFLTDRAAPEGRVGVDLGGGQVLSIRKENLEPVLTPPAGQATHLFDAKALPDEMGNKRTLARDNALLHEFNGSRDPDVLALYYHFNDRAFDCFNAPEYHTQMLRYYAANITVVAVVPRTMQDNEYLLVCLQNKELEKNTLCELAFQCLRQFAGISMLVKKRCFVCHKPGAPLCTCMCACFCSKSCKDAGWESHKKLCKLVQTSKITLEEESVQLLK
jgi:hypothetical protein